jgi:hypothetical protein
MGIETATFRLVAQYLYQMNKTGQAWLQQETESAGRSTALQVEVKNA